MRSPPTSATQRLALLFPAGVITAFSVGRGPGNLALVAMLCFAIYLLLRTQVSFPRWIWIILAFLSVLASSLLLYGLDISGGAESWLRLSLSVLSTLVLSVSIAENPVVDPQAGRTLWFMSVAALLSYILHAGYFMVSDAFIPANQLNGLHLAALLPLGLIALRARLSQVLGYALLTLAILAIGNSRTEIMMLLLGVTASVLFYLHRIAWLIAIIPAVFAAVMAYGLVFRAYDNLSSSNAFALLNTLSSERLILWRMAIDHPPANTLIGAGSGQSPHFFQAFGYSHLSFHNAFLETWYDAGWLGFALLMFGMVYLLRRLPFQYRHLAGHDRWSYACFFGAFITALIACLLDRGYSTALFNVFLFYCLAVLWRYPASPPSPILTRP